MHDLIHLIDQDWKPGKSGTSGPTGFKVWTLWLQEWGRESVTFLPIWSRDFAIPHNGSFSVDKIKLLREKPIKRSQCGKTYDNMKWLESLEKEIQCRDRKQTFKKKKYVKGTEKVAKKSHRSLYSPFTGCGSPLLNACFPPPQ